MWRRVFREGVAIKLVILNYRNDSTFAVCSGDIRNMILGSSRVSIRYSLDVSYSS